ncbi:MAG: hypothetical protein IKG56_01660 [Clostridia bacterium]|nr:hypothetical protein [Clostridia bacterium]
MKKDIVIGILVVTIIGICIAFYMYVKNGKKENNSNEIVKVQNIAEAEEVLNIINESQNDVDEEESVVENIFTDNICLAIGYVTSANEARFAKQYFGSSFKYKAIAQYDYRDENNKTNKPEDSFVFIPKDENVKISIYDCNINEEGEIKAGSLLKDNITEPFSLAIDNDELTTPKICIKYEINGFEDLIPLVFNGDNGQLSLLGHEMEVLDITMY